MYHVHVVKWQSLKKMILATESCYGLTITTINVAPCVMQVASDLTHWMCYINRKIVGNKPILRYK